jgi:electron transport complex protein RnfG
MARHVLNLALRLILICAVAAIGLGLTYATVKDRIAEMEQEEREEAGAEVLAPLGAIPEEDPDVWESLSEEFPDLVAAFRGIDDNGQQVGYAFVVETKGYNKLTTAVGVDNNCKITGIEVVTNEETPGIGGAAIDSDEFMGQFLEQGPDNLRLGVGVDAYSGATLTSRGITDAVNMALDMCRYIKESRGR